MILLLHVHVQDKGCVPYKFPVAITVPVPALGWFGEWRKDPTRPLSFFSFFFVSNSNGLQPNSDGLQPNSGLQPTCIWCFSCFSLFVSYCLAVVLGGSWLWSCSALSKAES